jgi:hypothetical protein
MLTSMVQKFVSFGPVDIILVVMVGVGVAEQAGLMTALIKKIVRITPRRAAAWILVTLGVLSSIASDAGYLVLIPLGAAAFLSLGRHPLAGLAATFAGVAGVFGVNVLIAPIDGILTEMTNDAIHLLAPTRSIYRNASMLMHAAVATADAARAVAAGRIGTAAASLFQRGVGQSLLALAEALPQMGRVVRRRKRFAATAGDAVPSSPPSRPIGQAANG